MKNTEFDNKNRKTGIKREKARTAGTYGRFLTSWPSLLCGSVSFAIADALIAAIILCELARENLRLQPGDQSARFAFISK